MLIKGTLSSENCRREDVELPKDEIELTADNESMDDLAASIVATELAIESRRIAELGDSTYKSAIWEGAECRLNGSSSTWASSSTEERNSVNSGCWLITARNVSLNDNLA